MASISKIMGRFHSLFWALYHPNQKSLARNTAIASITGGIAFVGGAALYLVIGRILPVDQFGAVELAIVVGTMLALLPSYGFDLFIIRELAQGTALPYQVVGNIVVAKLLLSLIALAGLSVYIQRSSVEQPTLFWLFGLSAILFSFTRFFNSVSKASENFFAETLTIALQNLIQLVLIVGTALFAELSAVVVAWLVLISRLLAFVFAFWLTVQEDTLASTRSSKTSISIAGAWRLVRGASPFALQSIFGTLYFQSDTLLVGELLNTTVLGYYQAGKRILNTFMQIAAMLMSAFYPRVAQSFSGNTQGQANLNISRKFIHIMLFAGSGLSLLFLLGAEPILVAFYTEKMRPATPALQILSLVFVVRFVASGYGLILISYHRQIIQLIGAIMAVAINVALNLLLVPRYGFLAAAWVNVLTNSAVFVLYAVFIHNSLGTLLLDHFGQTAKPLWSRVKSTSSRLRGFTIW